MSGKFVNKDGIIYYKGLVLGSFMDSFNRKTITQYSNDDQLFNVELAKEFMESQTKKPLVIQRGHSTKTQQWFTITEEY